MLCLRLEEFLYGYGRRKDIEVRHFGARRLFKLGLSLQSIRDQFGALILVLELKIAAYSPALVQDEAIVIDARNLSERMLRHVFRLLLRSFHEIYKDKFIWDVLLLADDSNTTSACGHRESVELENHGGERREKGIFWRLL